jgi:DNA (cytosine-5)-methyltransferase 1
MQNNVGYKCCGFLGDKSIIIYICNMIEGKFTSLEICTGAGGQALGLEQAGFHHVALVELESDYCKCLKINRPEWNVICQDVHEFSGSPFKDTIDLLAGGVPCPPFSVAGKQLGQDDERDLFPEMLRLVKEIQPRAVLIENVKGFLEPKFDSYRTSIIYALMRAGYRPHIKLLNASDYGVPQLRPRAVIVAIRRDIPDSFDFPNPYIGAGPTVGSTLLDLMAENGWKGAAEWAQSANKIAPTLVGGSKKHGGPDLGPTRARLAWAELGVDGRSVADYAPDSSFEGMPKLTPRMMARLQGFPDDWYFGDKKTVACRMIGNAFPPPVAKAVGEEIYKALYYGITDVNSKKQVSQVFA